MDEFEALFADLPRRGRGAAGGLMVEAGRELTPADAAAIAAGVAVSGTVSPLTRLRHSHHELARLLAEGRPAVEVCAITGKSQSWVSTLQRDPAFAELVEYYRVQKDAVYMDVHARLAGLGTDAINELQHRLDTDPEGLRVREVLEIAQLALDRSVAPPKGGTNNGGGPGNGTAAVQVNVSFVQPTPHPTDDVTGGAVELTPDGKGGFA